MLLSWLVHLYTASSALLAFLATRAIFEYRFRDAFFWLAGAMIVDATDGVLARAARVSQRTAFFHLGNLVEEGPTELIFNNPKEQRTQDYITGRFG